MFIYETFTFEEMIWGKKQKTRLRYADFAINTDGLITTIIHSRQLYGNSYSQTVRRIEPQKGSFICFYEKIQAYYKYIERDSYMNN